MGLCKCLLRSILFTLITVAVIIFIPNLPPNAKITKSLSKPKIRALEGPLAVNERLKNVELWHKGKLLGPEAFAEYNGELYTTLNGGIVAKLVDNQIITVAKTGKPCKALHEEKLCGRPLGIQFDKFGFLYVADAYYGILRFNLKKDSKEVIVSPNDKINGKKPKLFNSLAIASNGDIFWSDSSTQFELENLVFDVLSDPSGRLIHYDSKTKKNKVLIDNIHFANGVILSKDEDFVLVSETFLNRVHRYYLKGPKKGTHDIFIDGLPGFTDNLQYDNDDGFLIPLIEAIDNEHPSMAQLLYEFPLAKKFVARLMGLGELAMKTVDNYYPTDLAKSAIHFIGHYRSFSALSTLLPRQTILRVSKNGDIIESLTTSDKKLRGISEAFIFKDNLYLGSPSNDYIGRISLSEIGWSPKKVKRSVVDEATTTTTQKPTTTTQRPTTTTQRPTTTTQRPTTTTQKPTTTQRPTTTTTQKPTTTQRPTTTTQRPTTTTQKPTTTTTTPPPTKRSTTTPPPTRQTTTTPPPTKKTATTTTPPTTKPMKQTTAPPKKEVPKQATPTLKAKENVDKQKVKDSKVRNEL